MTTSCSAATASISDKEELEMKSWKIPALTVVVMSVVVFASTALALQDRARDFVFTNYPKR